jgi:hypothetical protein
LLVSALYTILSEAPATRGQLLGHVPDPEEEALPPGEEAASE